MQPCPLRDTLARMSTETHMSMKAQANIEFALGITDQNTLARAVTDLTRQGWSHEQISRMAVWEIDAADTRFHWSSKSP